MDIDWLSSESHVLLNPRMPDDDARRLKSYVVDLPGHLWLATSGTTGGLKLTALSKEAILTSAAAVNRHLSASPSDVWGCVLPVFHVGGLGIHARAFLTNSAVVSDAWDAVRFASSEDVSLSALVPAQVADLVSGGLRPRRRMRAIVVGGGALPDELYVRATALGWPLLPSYGMTECASQAATARPGSRDLIVLDHVEIRAEGGRLALRGASLFSGYGTSEGFVDPKRDGWFVTEDFGSVADGILRVEGRSADFVKIGGESVSLARLDAIAEEIGGLHVAVVAVADARLGVVVHLACDRTVDAEDLRQRFNERVHPFERARKVHTVREIPRTALGKLMRKRLSEAIPNVVE
jgi:O-succinylbenzoic acid--CoA ligase